MARSTLLGALTLIACVSLAAGCASVMEGLQDVLTTPTARVAGVDFVGFDLEGVELGFQVEIANPYGVDLPLVELGYGLASAGQQFLSGTAPVGGTVPAQRRRMERRRHTGRHSRCGGHSRIHDFGGELAIDCAR